MFNKKSRSLVIESIGFYMAHIINEGALSIIHLESHRKSGLINNHNASRVIAVKYDHAKYYAR